LWRTEDGTNAQRQLREPHVSREGSSFLNEHIGTTLGAGLGRVNAIASLPQGVRQLKRDARLNQ
jgi:hypothetical protein